MTLGWCLWDSMTMMIIITNVLGLFSPRRLFSVLLIALLILGKKNLILKQERSNVHIFVSCISPSSILFFIWQVYTVKFIQCLCLLHFRYEFVVRADRTNPRHHKAEEREIEKTIREANKIVFPFFFLLYKPWIWIFYSYKFNNSKIIQIFCLFTSLSHPDYQDPMFYFDVAIAILKQVKVLVKPPWKYLHWKFFILGPSIFPSHRFNLLTGCFLWLN